MPGVPLGMVQLEAVADLPPEDQGITQEYFSFSFGNGTESGTVKVWESLEY